MFLSGINTNSIPVQGTAIGNAIMTCAQSFSMEGMQEEGNKAIIVISDGENHEDDAVAAAEYAHKAGINVYCIGVGTPKGEPIPDDGGGLMKDRDGQIVVTKLDEETLNTVSKWLASSGSDMKVIFNVFKDEDRELSITDLAQMEGTNINTMSKVNNWDMKGYRSSWWWLRERPGVSNKYAPIVTVDGRVFENGKEVNRTGGAIRPVIWVKCGKTE